MALIPKVLSEIKDGPIHLFELYDRLKPELNDATDFLSVKVLFSRATEDADNAFLCKENHDLMGPYRMKDEFVNWLKVQYHMDFDGLSFRIALSSFSESTARIIQMNADH